MYILHIDTNHHYAQAAARKKVRIAKKVASTHGGAEASAKEARRIAGDMLDEASDVTVFSQALTEDDSQLSDESVQRHRDDSSAAAAGGAGVGMAWNGGIEGLGNIVNAPGGPAWVGRMGEGAGGSDFVVPEEREKLEFDGVFFIPNVNASDPAVLHQMMRDIAPVCVCVCVCVCVRVCVCAQKGLRRHCRRGWSYQRPWTPFICDVTHSYVT